MSANDVLKILFQNISKDCSFLEAYGLPSTSNMFSVLADAKSVIKQEDTILSLEGEYEVVGDIHGDLKSLISIFEQKGYPNKTKYIFLGDYIHRGKFSIEVVLMLFSMKVLFPENIYLIKGNHETSKICKNFNFFEECVERVNCEFFKAIRNVFRVLPLGAVVNGEIFCAHGGIPQTDFTLKELSHLKRPIPKDYQDIAEDILWSDPRNDIITGDFTFNSVRGAGNYFGPDALSEFFKLNDLKYLIRGHEVCNDGVDIPFEGCVTVFSSANYVESENHAATCTIGEDKSVSAELLDDGLESLTGFKSFINDVMLRKRVSSSIVVLDEIPDVSSYAAALAFNHGNAFSEVL